MPSESAAISPCMALETTALQEAICSRTPKGGAPTSMRMELSAGNRPSKGLSRSTKWGMMPRSWVLGISRPSRSLAHSRPGSPSAISLSIPRYFRIRSRESFPRTARTSNLRRGSVQPTRSGWMKPQPQTSTGGAIRL